MEKKWSLNILNAFYSISPLLKYFPGSLHWLEYQGTGFWALAHLLVCSVTFRNLLNLFWMQNPSSTKVRGREFPGGWVVKNHLPVQEMWVWSLGREDPLEKEMATTSVFLPGKSHGWRRLASHSPWGHRRVGHGLGTKQQQRD